MNKKVIAAFVLLGLGAGVTLINQSDFSISTPTEPTCVSSPSENKAGEFLPICDSVKTTLETTDFYARVTPTQLMGAWDNNRLNAEDTYNGVKVAITGQVRSIKGNVLWVGDGNRSMECRYNGNQRSNVARLNHNGPVSIQGTLVMQDLYGLGDIKITNCEIVSAY